MLIAPHSEAGEISLEWVVAQNPDLILGYWNVETIYEQLSQIAPTVAGLEGPVVYTWEVQVGLTGRALGKAEAAEALIRKTKDQITAVREKFPQMAAKTFSLSYMYSTSEIATIYAQGDAAVQFFRTWVFRFLRSWRPSRMRKQQLEEVGLSVWNGSICWRPT